jgi:6-pyruvoyltetrahydropterin/6-carboxytetrahydropterin synthase
MFTITKEFHFEAGHHIALLPGDHPCSRPHGHSYRVIVELKAVLQDEFGFLTDYRNLEPIKKILDEEFDHRYLNDFFPANPTAENLAFYFFNRFAPLFPQLAAVTVKETDKTSARYEPNKR